MCPICLIGDNLLRQSRIVIREETWDGEDIFIARGAPGVHLVSERFKSFCETHQILNVKLVDALDYSVDWYPGSDSI